MTNLEGYVFVKTSKCRACGRTLRWGDRTYEFDHKDNNPANNRQTNCYLVCRNCHGKHTVIKKRKIKGIFGQTVGYKTIKKKVGYKKPKKRATKKKGKTKRRKRKINMGLILAAHGIMKGHLNADTS